MTHDDFERGDVVEFQKKEKYRQGNAIKENVEEKTGVDLSDVNIHYNVPQPSEFQSLAYTYGNDIYLGSGQESALSHELYHVIQQKQGIVPVQGYINNLPYNQSYRLEQMAESNNYATVPLRKDWFRKTPAKHIARHEKQSSFRTSGAKAKS